MASKGSDTLRRGGLVAAGVVLLGEVSLWGGIWGLMYAQATPSESDCLLMHAAHDVRTLSSFSGAMSALCLPSCHYVPP